MYVQTLCTEVVVVWCLHHSTAAAVQLELKKGNSNIPLLLGRDLRNSTGSLINNISSYLTYDLYICTPTDWHGKTHGPSACRTMTYGGGGVSKTAFFFRIPAVPLLLTLFCRLRFRHRFLRET